MSDIRLILVKEILNTKSGKRKKKDGTFAPYTWTLFKGILEDESELEISTFSHIEKDKMYEGDLYREDYQGKKIWKFDSKGEFKEEPPPKEKEAEVKDLSQMKNKTINTTAVLKFAGSVVSALISISKPPELTEPTPDRVLIMIGNTMFDVDELIKKYIKMGADFLLEKQQPEEEPPDDIPF